MVWPVHPTPSRRASRLVATIAALAALAWTAACGGEVPLPEAPEAGQVGSASSAEAAALLDERDAVIIDVRTLEEYMDGHVVGAQHIDLEDEGLWERRTAALDPDRPTIVYSGSDDRSARAGERLVGQGFTEVYDLGAMADWDEGDLAVDR